MQIRWNLKFSQHRMLRNRVFWVVRLGRCVIDSMCFEGLYCLYLQGAAWLSQTDFKRIVKGSNSFSAACFSRNMPCLNIPDGSYLFSPLHRPSWHTSSRNDLKPVWSLLSSLFSNCVGIGIPLHQLLKMSQRCTIPSFSMVSDMTY